MKRDKRHVYSCSSFNGLCGIVREIGLERHETCNIQVYLQMNYKEKCIYDGNSGIFDQIDAKNRGYLLFNEKFEVHRLRIYLPTSKKSTTVFWITAPPKVLVTAEFYPVFQIHVQWDLKTVGFEVWDSEDFSSQELTLSLEVLRAPPSFSVPAIHKNCFQVVRQSHQIRGEIYAGVVFKENVHWCKCSTRLRLGETEVQSDFTSFNAATGEVGEPLIREIKSTPFLFVEENILKTIYFEKEDVFNRMHDKTISGRSMTYEVQPVSQDQEGRDCPSVCNYGHFSRSLLAKKDGLRTEKGSSLMSRFEKPKKEALIESKRFQSMNHLLAAWNMVNAGEYSKNKLTLRKSTGGVDKNNNDSKQYSGEKTQCRIKYVENKTTRTCSCQIHERSHLCKALKEKERNKDISTNKTEKKTGKGRNYCATELSNSCCLEKIPKPFALITEISLFTSVRKTNDCDPEIIAAPRNKRSKLLKRKCSSIVLFDDEV